MIVKMPESVRTETEIIGINFEESTKRQQEEMMQDEVRSCLREVISGMDGSWTTAKEISNLAKMKYPHLAQEIGSKSVSEYLKNMHLRMKKIPASFYLCEKQYASSE